MLKKVLFILSFVLVLTSCINLSDNGDSYEYEIIDSQAIITKYIGDSEVAVIPEIIKEKGKTYEVTSIGDVAFYSNNKIKRLQITKNITSIGTHSFFNCENLEAISIDSIEFTIGSNAFEGCDSVKVLTYNGTLEDWCKFDFTANSNPAGSYTKVYMMNEENEIVHLESLKVPTSVTSIKDYQFMGFNVERIELHDNITSIGAYSFSNCQSILSINIPASVTSIGDGAFSGCNSVKNVYIPNSVINMGMSVFGSYSTTYTINVDLSEKPATWHDSWCGNNVVNWK